MSDAEEKVTAAVESVAASEAQAAVSQAAVAEAVVTEKTSEAAAVTVAAAQAATALAQETSAAANIEAAKIVNEKEEELAWLRNHAQETANSLQSLHQRQQSMETTLTPLSSQMTELAKNLQLLIPRKSEEPPALDPASLSEGGEGPEGSNPPKKEAPKKKTRTWI